MLVRIEKDWEHPDIFRQCPGQIHRWGGVEFTTEPVEECDLLVVLNGPVRDIRVRCPVGARWLFSQESPVEMYRWQTDSFKYFDRIYTFWTQEAGEKLCDDHSALPWQIGYTYDEVRSIECAANSPDKSDRISWVTSNASHKPGHVTRMGLLKYLRDSGFDFDLFGRGFQPISDKFDGLFPYKYSLAIENYSCANYWTEKISDCFLSWTIPIYWGATNIDRYFPRGSFIKIDPLNPADAVKRIREAVREDHFSTHFAALREARELVLEKYQFFPHIESLSRHEAARLRGPKFKHFIPTNPNYYSTEPAGRLMSRRLKSLIRRALWSLR